METRASIVVITYNSSKTVCDTLNSILKQNYDKKLIELIITDDASTDSTKVTIQQWLQEHAIEFSNTIALFQKENGGTSKNCNNGWKVASSPWIKTIAGDDILLPDCIRDNIDYVNNHQECDIVFSQCIEFSVSGAEIRQGKVHPDSMAIRKFNSSESQQYRHLLKENFCPAPTAFVRNSKLAAVGYADERFRLIDDWPVWLKLSGSGNRLHYMEKPTVLYRKDESITNSTSRLININYYYGLNSINREMIKPVKGIWPFICYIDNWIEYNSRISIAKMFGNKPAPFAKKCLRAASILRPLWIWNKISKYRN